MSDDPAALKDEFQRLAAQLRQPVPASDRAGLSAAIQRRRPGPSRSSAATSAPSDRQRAATAWPIPEAAPVTSTREPVSMRPRAGLPLAAGVPSDDPVRTGELSRTAGSVATAAACGSGAGSLEIVALGSEAGKNQPLCTRALPVVIAILCDDGGLEVVEEWRSTC